MKKSVISTFTIVTIGLLLNISSCTKPSFVELFKNGAKEIAVFSSFDSMNMYNAVWVSAMQKADNLDSSYRISMNASFKDTITKIPVSFTSVSINARTVLPGADHQFSFVYSGTNLTEGLNLYGTNVKVKIVGATSTDTLTRLVYMPKRIVHFTKEVPIYKLDVANNLTVKWATDPACTWGYVGIRLIYNAEESQYMRGGATTFASGLPSVDTALTYVVPDNGSYTINKTDLQVFKSNSIVRFQMVRGTEVVAVLPVSQKRVFIFATSAAYSSTMTVSCSAIWQNTGVVSCEKDDSGNNTGNQLVQQKDVSTCSATYGQLRNSVVFNKTACPLH